MQLLRQIAESPASCTPVKPNIFSRAASSAARTKQPKLGEWRVRQERRTEKIKSPNTGAEKTTGTGKSANAAKALRMASPGSASSNQDVFASPAVSRKRARSSPESGDAATGSRNPFTAYGHYSRPPPPSPSSRLGLAVGSLASDVDLSQDGAEDDAAPTAVTSAPRRTARDTPETSPRGGDGSVSSPVSLVDLSQADEGDGDGPDKPENVPGASEELRDSPSRPEALASEALTPEALAGAGTREDDDAPSPVLLPERGSTGGGAFDSEHGTSVVEGKRHDRGAEQLLASKLFFLVSGNTGRVHVYKKEEDEENDGSGFDYGLDGEEDAEPRHCRLVGCLSFFFIHEIGG